MQHRPGMVPHVIHPHTTMHPTHPISPIRPMHSTGLGYLRYGGGGGQYGTMPGQYVNQIQMVRPAGTGMNLVRPALPHMPLMSLDPTLRTFSEQGVSQQHAPPPSQQPHTPPPPPPPLSSTPQMDQTQLPHFQSQTLSPMGQTQSPSSSLQPVTTSSTPQNQTQEPAQQQQKKFGPQDPAAHFTPPSTSWLHPRGVIQPGSSPQQGLVSESLV